MFSLLTVIWVKRENFDMESFGGCTIAALADLLKSPDDPDSDSDEEKPRSGMAKMNPGDVGGKSKSSEGTKISNKKMKDSKDIWCDEEVPVGAEYDDIYDTRQQPQYEMLYKQAVTSEDMFLQMGNKNASTASCEDLIIKVSLPGTKLSDIILDVKETFFDCRTAKYKLGLFLPHPVDAKNAKAQWDGTNEKLSVTLKLVRDYDFVNL